MLWSVQLSRDRQKPFNVWWLSAAHDTRLHNDDSDDLCVTHYISCHHWCDIMIFCLCRCWSHSEVPAIHQEVTIPGARACAPLPEARAWVPGSPEVRGQRSPRLPSLRPELSVSAARPGQVHRVWCGPRGPALRDRQAGAADGEPRGPRVQAGEETRGEHGWMRGHVLGPLQHLTKGACDTWHNILSSSRKQWPEFDITVGWSTAEQ